MTFIFSGTAHASVPWQATGRQVWEGGAQRMVGVVAPECSWQSCVAVSRQSSRRQFQAAWPPGAAWQLGWEDRGGTHGKLAPSHIPPSLPPTPCPHPFDVAGDLAGPFGCEAGGAGQWWLVRRQLCQAHGRRCWVPVSAGVQPPHQAYRLAINSAMHLVSSSRLLPGEGDVRRQ